jgi:hypothetical protein
VIVSNSFYSLFDFRSVRPGTYAFGLRMRLSNVKWETSVEYNQSAPATIAVKRVSVDASNEEKVKKTKVVEQIICPSWWNWIESHQVSNALLL